MRELLRREALYGTGPAAMLSSVTFNINDTQGGTGLTALNNRLNGNISVHGREFDSDWFMDANAVTGNFSRVLVPRIILLANRRHILCLGKIQEN
jgi:hypothetical protein